MYRYKENKNISAFKRVKFVIQYDGEYFYGWQKQRSLSKFQSIQGSLEYYCSFMMGCPIFFYVCGRTDKGVHALGQVAHADVPRKWSCENIQKALNFYMKDIPISVLSVHDVSFTFDARFSCIARQYKYYIYNCHMYNIFHTRSWHISRDISVSQMVSCSHHLVGCHDFQAFRLQGCYSSTSVRTIHSILFDISQCHKYITITLKAPSFMYKQVRSMVGILVHVGQSKWTIEDFKDFFTLNKNCKIRPPLAPSHGLFFHKAFYKNYE